MVYELSESGNNGYLTLLNRMFCFYVFEFIAWQEIKQKIEAIIHIEYHELECSYTVTVTTESDQCYRLRVTLDKIDQSVLQNNLDKKFIRENRSLVDCFNRSMMAEFN